MRSQFLVMTESHRATEATALTIQHSNAEMERVRSTEENAVGQ